MKYGIFALLLCSLLYISCKKSKNNVTGGGTGGNATLLVIPEHGGVLIDSCTVFIKYGVNNAPSDGVYDDSAVVALNDTIPIAAFHNLTNGIYYVFGRGYHATYSPPYLKGGIPVTISQQDSSQSYLLLGSYTSW
jgi:hypothetical protein